MADFVAILEKAIGSLPENHPDARKAIYAKARMTIERKLRAIEPPPAEEVISRQMTLLDEAVATVESRHAAQVATEPAMEPELPASGVEPQAATPAPGAQGEAGAHAAPSDRLPRSAENSPASSSVPEPAAEPLQEAEPARPAVDPFLSTGAASGEGLPGAGSANIAGGAEPPAAPPEPEESVTRPIVVPPAPAAAPQPAPAPSPAPAAAAPPIAEPPISGPPTEPVHPASHAAAPAVAADGAPPYIADLDGEFDAGPPPLAGSDRYPVARKRRGGAGKWIGGGAALLLLGGVAAGGYLYRGELSRMGGTLGEAVSAFFGDEPQVGAPEDAGSREPAADGEIKDDARLGLDGQEEPGNQASGEEAGGTASGEQAATGDDNGAVRDVSPPASDDQAEAGAVRPVEEDPPAADSGTQAAGETTGAADEEQTEPLTAEPADAQEAAQPAVTSVAGEKAYLYEEAAGSAGASRDEAFVGWSIANEPPEAGMPPEPVIKGFMEVPGRGLTMSVSIKRNLDEALPASHLIELIFTAPPEFSGGNVDNISRFVMKGSEQARGESLVGVPARIDTGFFLIALNNLPQAQETNLRLLDSAEWIDIPVSYANGRRALVTLEKGPSGKEIFANALADWQNRQ